MNKKMKRQKSILPGALGVRVIKTKQYPKGDINFALRSFKKELKQSGKMEELRERRYFVPKSAKKREQMKRAKYFQWVDDQNRN
jgi:ribosomal protein S21